jgi:hypothetical protein
MELTPYLEGLQRDLAAAAAPGGPDVHAAAEILSGSLEASARLCLLEALSDAAAEITTKLDGGSVDVRLRGREAQFVVTASEAVSSPTSQLGPATGPTGPADGESGDVAGRGITESAEIARITLRLPEGLKEAVERTAAAEGISVNAWLVRAIGYMVAPPGPPGPPPTPAPGWPFDPPGRGRPGRRVTGFAQA